MKKKIKNWVLKNYPPVVMSILMSLLFLAVAALLAIIEKLTTDLPILYQ